MTAHILPAMNASIEPIAHRSGNGGKLTAGTRSLSMTPHILPAMNASIEQSRTKAGAKANSQPERAHKSGGQTHSGNSKHATKRREGKDTYLPIIMGNPSPNPPPKPPPYGKAMATAQSKITLKCFSNLSLQSRHLSKKKWKMVVPKLLSPSLSLGVSVPRPTQCVRGV
jgi:hypothetical protein